MRSRKPIWIRYGVMLVSILLAFGLTSLVPQLREQNSFMFFVGAVMFSAWFGGWVPGLIGALFAMALANYYFYEPSGVFLFHREVIISHIGFMSVAILVCFLTAKLAAAREGALAQRRWFESVLSSIGDAVVATDAIGDIQYLNRAAERLLAIKSGEVNGRQLDTVLRLPSDELKMLRKLDANPLLRSEAILNSPRQSVLTLENVTMPIEYTVAQHKDDEARQMGWVLAVRDTGEREEARNRILEYQKNLQSLASQLCLAEERERRQIAIGLHDRVGQALVLCNYKIQDARSLISDETALARLDEVNALLRQLVAETRSLTFELSPPILYEFGLEAALEWLCENFQQEHALRCIFQRTGLSIQLPLNQRVLLFQASRELLTNVWKHAHATQASLAVRNENGAIVVTVEDDGEGFKEAKSALPKPSEQGFGLFNIRERVQNMGGSVSIDTSPGRGTTVELSLPAAADILMAETQ